ncbi:hypothetical protein IP90_00516 [Luteimonas cucumeris]|uniref:TonB-like protein n=1 Tax=Luteimonas cucumeris TaxID=985012 RepID=A0A562LF60_9GAMM|nr:hypothetical protein [Luteimonas cucumeris]TWI06251.1 hypothetical protein IP90_00516 [Luteimonas cucumeris]
MDRHLKAGWVVAGCLGLFAATGMAAERVKIANEGGIRDQWMLADGIKLAAPGYPAAFAERGDNVCVAMGYAINPDGTTSDFGLLKAWNSATGEDEPVEGFWDAFSQASAGALSEWKFKPRPEVAEPETVYTVATMNFMGKQATDPAGLRSHCNISDLASFVQKQKWDKTQDGSLEKSELQNYLRRQQSRRTMVENPRGSLSPASR